MSRNFELLQQIEKEHEVFPTAVPTAISRNGRKRGLDLDAIGREERMKLVQRLFLLPGSKAPRLVVFCGVQTGDGSSWVCARASETLASEVKASVCLVDANLRTPVLHQHFGTDNLLGLADAVHQSGPARGFAHQLNGGNFWLMTCGSKTTDPHSLLASDGLRSCLAELRAEFDYVMVDGPPVNLYADTALLGKLADGVVLVVQANSTHREAARKAMESLASANVAVLGVVLNKRTFPIPESLYRKI
jgi:capsular exopolysaccharide synthesis family protein